MPQPVGPASSRAGNRTPPAPAPGMVMAQV
jgi:hypothetical protein